MTERTIRTLVIEDDPAVRLGVVQALELAGLPASGFERAEDALAGLDARFAGVVVSDVRLPGIDGLALLGEVMARDREIPVILITGHGGISMAVQAIRDGAYDFIEKPFTSDRLADVVRRGLAHRELVLENRRLKEQVLAKSALFMLGDSAPIAQLRRMVAAIGPTEADVLIYGETGTGKEVLARAVHAASGRSGEFVAINCAALPETVFESEIFGHEAGAFTGALKKRIGKIEHARGGTLFLDEIENMSPQLQVKLLRVLQERVVERLGSNQPIAVDCRIVAASKADLKALSDAGEFRADLYYRLNVVCLELPPLRERKGDIPLLAAHFLRQAAERYHLQPPAPGQAQLARWMAQDWPGNVRELRNAVDRFCLGVASAPASALSGSLNERVARYERGLIEAALRDSQGRISVAAEQLQIPRKTLHDRIARLGIEPDELK